MIITDSHIHTNFSSDSEYSMEEMILAGIKNGLRSMCFTEHYDPCFPDTEDHLDFLLDFNQYEETFMKLKEKYSGSIELLHGVELGVQPFLSIECHDFYQTFGNRYDFIIHSCHCIDGQDPYYGTYFACMAPKEGVAHYFSTLLDNLDVFTEYQSVGHLDYICRYMNTPRPEFSYEDYQDILDQILRRIIDRGKALEVNTAGWKYGMPDPNPPISILKRYRELGGELITIGSDAHQPAHIAYDFHRLPDYLKAASFKYYAYFKEKKPQMILL